MKKVCIVLGTRPEIIKMSPIIRVCQKTKTPFFIIHTNQHYSKDFDSVFFRELELPSPKYNLNVGSGTHAESTAAMLVGIEPILFKEKPGVVLVEGDTNSVLAGALAAVKLHIPVGHVEAGLRSYNRMMPEEVNRVLVDHCSDFLFAPTRRDAQTLKKEGIPSKKIFITGNTIVDAVRESAIRAENKSDILERLKLKKASYILVTAHREENVDSKKNLSGILSGIASVGISTGLPVVYPIHHRTIKRIKEFGLTTPSAVRAIGPVGFFDFLKLEAHARLIITDSGGVQEEASILRVPCVTVRTTTERQETVHIKSNILAGTDPKKILACAQKMLSKKGTWHQPFGNGKTGDRIVRFLRAHVLH